MGNGESACLTRIAASEGEGLGTAESSTARRDDAAAVVRKMGMTCGGVQR